MQMAKKKLDGVVEAVHYKPNGEVDWVRAYVRRGAAWSDHVLMQREELIKRLNAGKRYFVGRRIPLKASTFEVTSSLRVIRAGGKEYLATNQSQAERDHLDGVPLI
jgi:hypothetical protein